MAVRRVLIYEPTSVRARVIREFLQSGQFWAVVVEDRQEALTLLSKQYFHVCVWPVSDASELSELSKLKQIREGLCPIAAIDRNDSSLVVACMRSGASNVWVTSNDAGDLGHVIEETLSRVLPEETSSDVEFPFPNFVGRHPKILDVFRLILSIRNTESTVLITGESGTGKEVVARAIHSVSPRRKRPWVAVNCGAIPVNLLESELFGHVKGAFTGATQNRPGRFQLAGAGTLFLDEISDLPFDLQAKILRAIQHKTFEPVGSPHSLKLDARIIAATNQDLEAAVVEKKFREDLFYRLNVIPIFLPPLRARKSDIPLLVRSFFQKFSEANGKDFRGISEEAMKCMMEYHWPGNVRELENLIERVVVLKSDDTIVDVKDIPVHHFRRVKLDRFVANVELPESGLDFNDAVNEFENELILQALQKTSGNKNQAASLLNLNRTTLVEKLKRKGLKITA